MELKKPLEHYNIKELNDLFNNKILITNNFEKNAILQKSFDDKQLLSFKILNFQQAQTFFLPNIDPAAKYEIYKTLKNYELSNQIYKNLLNVINKKEINNSNINKIQEIKEWIKILENKNLITTNELSYNKDVFITDLQFKNINEKFILLKNNYNFPPKQEIKINEFKDFEKEVFYTFNKISELLNKKININNIKLYINNNYIDYAKTVANFYKIPVNIEFKYNLNYAKDVKEISELLQKDTVNRLIKSKHLDKLSEHNYNEIINIINLYIDYLDDIELSEFIIKEINAKYLTNYEMENVLEIKPINEFSYNKNNYNFIIGFNNLDFISYYKDKDYLNDKEKKSLNLINTVDKNKQLNSHIKNVINYLFSDENTHISYSKKVLNQKVQIYLENDNTTIIQNNLYENKNRFSKSADQYLFQKEMYKFKNYNIKTELLNNLNENLTSLEKQKYYFKFNELKNWDFNKFKKEKEISSTLIEKYYKCSFIFYVENILGLKAYPKNKISLHVGSYIHEILERIVNEYSYDKYFNKKSNNLEEKIITSDINLYSSKVLEENEQLFNDINPNNKELIIKKMNYFLIDLCILILNQILTEKFQVYAVEKNLEQKYKDFNFVGKVDKILNYNNYFMVVDYKSSKSKLDLDDNILNLGVNLQNLIYFILLNENVENVEFAGTYRYKICPEIIKDKENEFKREGYTINKEEVLNNININNYQGLKLKNDGTFTANSQKYLLDENQIEEKIKIVKQKIDQFLNNIENNVIYEAKPLIYDKLSPCEYCSYLNVCYKDN